MKMEEDGYLLLEEHIVVLARHILFNQNKHNAGQMERARKESASSSTTEAARVAVRQGSSEQKTPANLDGADPVVDQAKLARGERRGDTAAAVCTRKPSEVSMTAMFRGRASPTNEARCRLV